MNKKSLLFVVVASLMTMSAGAQLKKSDVAIPSKHLQSITQKTPVVTEQEMLMYNPGTPVEVRAEAPATSQPYYRRPAGAFFSPLIAVNDCGFYSFWDTYFLLVKPCSDYTYHPEEADNYFIEWDFYTRGDFYRIDDRDLTIMYDLGDEELPIMWFFSLDSILCGSYQYPDLNWSEFQPNVMIHPDINRAEMGGDDIEYLLSSKTMINGGRDGNTDGLFSRYYGAKPWGDNQYGWWFGKNASHVDGMAMAFEKPQHPYLLKNVYLQAYTDMVTAPVKMTCKVYRLDEIPDYVNDNMTSAYLPDEPGTLVCTGEAIVTPTTAADKNGLIKFTLYGLDGDDPEMIYEYNPTIDYPILVCVDGYNDEGMEDLVEFSAFCCIDDQTDEGYGELCYLKEGIFEVSLDENGDTIYDENGDPERHFTGEYIWRGLNNRFMARDDEDWPEKRATMMTGLTLFISVENPYFVYNYAIEDGEYTFPAEGGEFKKTYEYCDTTIIVDCIEFFSYTASEDWEVTWNGSDALPDWLEIELEDEMEDGEFTGIVRAYVTAAPLPAGEEYRSAVIRFGVSGYYIDYKFSQGQSGIDEQLINSDAVPVGYYDVTGRQLSGLQQGINIVKMSDGTARKLFQK